MLLASAATAAKLLVGEASGVGGAGLEPGVGGGIKVGEFTGADTCFTAGAGPEGDGAAACPASGAEAGGTARPEEGAAAEAWSVGDAAAEGMAGLALEAGFATEGAGAVPEGAAPVDERGVEDAGGAAEAPAAGPRERGVTDLR